MPVSRITFFATGAAVALSAGSAGAAGIGDATLLALYKKPVDAAAFDSYYSTHRAPLATLPGLQLYTISKGLTDKDHYYQVATLKFVSDDAIKSALGSTQGAAVGADLKNFAQAGTSDI